MRRHDYKNALQLLTVAAENNLNAMIVGTHGIGKTYLVLEIAKKLGLKMKYWSASTMDPYIDLVGVPYVNANKGLDFAIRDDIMEMEFLFFDELNRAHLKVRNAVLELIQFKCINGRRLPKLRMVWAAINPPTEDYQVEDLDPALRDRFHLHIELKPTYDVDYYATILGTDAAEKLIKWINGLQDEERLKTTPRRLEYIGRCIQMGFHPKDIACEATSEAALELLWKMFQDDKRIKSATDFMDPKKVKNNFDEIMNNIWTSKV